MPSLWRSGGTRHAGRHQLFNHRTPVHGEVRSGFTRSIPIRRALERDRSAARIGGACGRHAHSRSVELGRCEGEGAGGHGRLLRRRRHAPGPRREVRGEGPDADDGVVPEERERRPRGNGLLTQAPPNTGAGWYTLATGAWPGVHGSTNNTFHINGQPFGEPRRAAFDPNVLQAESIAQSAERGGLKVAQVEWAGGRNATIKGPTIDFQSFFSGRGVATNFIGKAGDALFDDAPFIAVVRAAVRPPDRVCRPGAVPGGRADAGRRLDRNVPATYSPAMEMRLRVLDFGVDKYGLNAYIFDSTQRQHDQLRPGAVLAHEERRRHGRHPAQGPVGRRQGQDRSAAPLGRARPPACSSRSRSSPATCPASASSTPPSRRAIASWPTWPGEPGFTGDFEEYLAQTFPTSTAADFAILEAGVTSEETYVQQGLYWATGHQPMLEYVVETYKPGPAPRRHADDGRVPAPVPRAGHAEAARTAQPNPAYDDVDLNGVADGRVEAARGVHPRRPTRSPTRR